MAKIDNKSVKTKSEQAFSIEFEFELELELDRKCKFKIQNSKFKITFSVIRHSEEGLQGPDEGISFPLSRSADFAASLIARPVYGNEIATSA